MSGIAIRGGAQPASPSGKIAGPGPLRPVGGSGMELCQTHPPAYAPPPTGARRRRSRDGTRDWQAGAGARGGQRAQPGLCDRPQAGFRGRSVGGRLPGAGLQGARAAAGRELGEPAAPALRRHPRCRHRPALRAHRQRVGRAGPARPRDRLRRQGRPGGALLQGVPGRLLEGAGDRRLLLHGGGAWRRAAHGGPRGVPE